MSSITEQLLTAAYNAFVGIPNQTTFRSRAAAVSLTEGNAILIEPENEPTRPLSVSQVIREFTMVVRILARGAIPDQVADPIRVAMHAALMADPTLGGLCQRVIELDTQWSIEEADQTAVQVECRYKLVYLTKTNSLTTLA